jgi:hypothetical protein
MGILLSKTMTRRHKNSPPPAPVRYKGQADPNAVLRGETALQPGDTFIVESLDRHGFTAMILHRNGALSTLTSGTREKCESVARGHSGVYVVPLHEHLRRRGNDCPCSACNPDHTNTTP